MTTDVRLTSGLTRTVFFLWWESILDNLARNLLGSNLPPHVSIGSPPNEHDTPLVSKPVRSVFW
jgi:hypothetical protein